jgi:hypothetical protein
LNRRALVFTALAIATGCYYEWGVRATGTEFQWRAELPGYYDLLARGFADGHLYVAYDPDPRLLALPNPQDPNIPPDIPKMFDAVLYNRHFYLYHGAGPAILLFLPWRLVFHHDLPEGFAVFLLCFGGYLFAALTLTSFLRVGQIRIAAGLYGLMLLGVGFCTSIPFLLNRPTVYEVAIAGGYFCVAAGFFCLAKTFELRGRFWPVASGLLFGLAVACRPHMIIAGGLALLTLAITKRHAPAFLGPFVAIGLLIAAYNFARFGNPAEFGLKYQITGPNQGELHPRLVNVLPGIHYMLMTRPVFTKVFPWALLEWPPPDFPRPPGYFIEPIVGAFFLAPFLPGAFLALFARRLGPVRWTLVVAGCSIFVFLILTGLSTQRYEVDFLPWLALAALAGIGALIGRSAGAARWAASAIFAMAVLFGVFINLAMAISGPFDDLMKNKPARYVAIARWFSPFPEYRPELNPRLSADIVAPIAQKPDHLREDLFLAGRQLCRYELFLDHLNGRPVLVSRFCGSDVSKEMAPDEKPALIQARYSPESHEMLVRARGEEVLRQKVEGLITAPAQIVRR